MTNQRIVPLAELEALDRSKTRVLTSGLGKLGISSIQFTEDNTSGLGLAELEEKSPLGSNLGKEFPFDAGSVVIKFASFEGVKFLKESLDFCREELSTKDLAQVITLEAGELFESPVPDPWEPLTFTLGHCKVALTCWRFEDGTVGISFENLEKPVEWVGQETGVEPQLANQDFLLRFLHFQGLNVFYQNYLDCWTFMENKS